MLTTANLELQNSFNGSSQFMVQFNPELEIICMLLYFFDNDIFTAEATQIIVSTVYCLKKTILVLRKDALNWLKIIVKTFIMLQMMSILDKRCFLTLPQRILKNRIMASTKILSSKPVLNIDKKTILSWAAK